MSTPPELAQAEAQLRMMPGVISVGWDGQYIVVVVVNEAMRGSIPSSFGRFPVRTMLSGPLRSF